jgi:tripartite-type tricarboxylate transporter receptor subunit TctC
MPIRFRRPRTAAALAALTAIIAASGPTFGQDAVANFYRGKTVSITVGSSAGGGYDTYARLLSRHIGNHISGHPNIVVQNMPGAGSNKATGYIYSVAPKDGTAIGAVFPGAILQPLLGDAPVQHLPTKLTYLGSANSDVYLCFVRSDAPATTFKDALTKEVILGASNQGGTTRDLPAMLNNLVGAKFRIVTGYAGSKEIGIAIERNEVHGACGIGWTGLPTLYPHWFEKKLVRIILQLAVKGHPDLKGVPLATEFATGEKRQAMELILSQGLFGRPYILPPGVPADRAAALRKAFAAALADKALLAESAKMKLDIEPIAGDDLQKKIAELYALPAKIVQTAKQSMIVRPTK